jgi:transposase InsO family protein
LWLADGSCVRLRPAYPDHVWSYDFVADRTSDGRAIRMLTLIDEHTRECLAIDVARSLKSEDVLERLNYLFVRRGVPSYLRSDNGSEFTATKVRQAGARRRDDAVHRAGQSLEVVKAKKSAFDTQLHRGVKSA